MLGGVIDGGEFLYFNSLLKGINVGKKLETGSEYIQKTRKQIYQHNPSKKIKIYQHKKVVIGSNKE